ncbi:fumarylacetoacetate hydrolase family protein [Uliginosibacterium sp. H3]|uniref:Fumarylacetoacetate hydrolase family protein n=1 Tax=Uliginosibacterium silvisoli TaxID=3114758 RepID=A0ABU6K6W9_9RHOO|nr:fumarylacetoacetate hydrolase family protein [Uliginosibacterium sp. H3]
MSAQEFVVAPPATVSLPVAGSNARFPVRRIYCVGRNYLDHIREMGNDVKEPPIFFAKPTDAIVQDGATIAYAAVTENFHYEVELAVAIGRSGHNITEGEALSHVFGYAVALDMTRRDLQKALSSKGSPWDVAKGFDQACPCGTIHPAASVGKIDDGAIKLSVNGEVKQQSTLDHMIWNVPQIIAELSRLFVLQPGDLLLTGTPAGVGPVIPGDVMVGSIDKLGSLTITVGARG